MAKFDFSLVFSWMPLRCSQCGAGCQLGVGYPRPAVHVEARGSFGHSLCASASQLVVFKNSSRGVRAGSLSHDFTFQAKWPCQSSTAPVQRRTQGVCLACQDLATGLHGRGAEAPLMLGRAG